MLPAVDPFSLGTPLTTVQTLLLESTSCENDGIVDPFIDVDDVDGHGHVACAETETKEMIAPIINRFNIVNSSLISIVLPNLHILYGIHGPVEHGIRRRPATSSTLVNQDIHSLFGACWRGK